ncbi:MAG: 2-oxoglutarate dehydrogenase E1 component, partial [Robiginitomaculum sp.]|nr:2-oxoglutarate dehydrogenase E1 component [Robiginitomaculum sp.]
MNDKPRSQTNQDFLDTGYLDGANAAYLEQMQVQYTANPNSVDDSWRAYFGALGEGASNAKANADGPTWVRGDWPQEDTSDWVEALGGLGGGAAGETALKAEIKKARPAASNDEIEQAARDSIRALMLIRAYRIRGHMVADLDPLGLMKRVPPEDLDPALLGFGPDDLDRPIYIGGVLGMESASINEMMPILKRTYCGTFGVQFMHVSDPDERSWLQKRIEGPDKEIHFTKLGRKGILQKLIEAQAFEDILQRRYPGTKRFGLDGGESLVPALEQIIKRGGALGMKDINFGMPHRGRLNILAAVLSKPYSAIFFEFLGGVSAGAEDFGSGDVKYHLGASSDREFDGNE